ncbi:MAG: hypothetical protein IJM91_07275 [Lachnospiraceae bacterium]|nr:hypothetical protein [Lachnospiraceae bacterium]
MNELKEMLIAVSDSYFDFVIAVLDYAKQEKDNCNAMADYIFNHPDAQTSDILEYMIGRDNYFDYADKIVGVLPPEEQRA